jgi:hypothetical protein
MAGRRSHQIHSLASPSWQGSINLHHNLNSQRSEHVPMTEAMNTPRPKQLAVLLMAAHSMPRARARDQQPDIAGNQLRAALLQKLIERDPQPEEVSRVLIGIVEQRGEPTGPTRAVACSIADELQQLQSNPELTAWLVDEAMRSSSRERHDRGRS